MPKSQYKQTNIKDGDSLEVISFVGGGWCINKFRNITNVYYQQ
jgi:hypothetical protein